MNSLIFFCQTLIGYQFRGNVGGLERNTFSDTKKLWLDFFSRRSQIVSENCLGYFDDYFWPNSFPKTDEKNVVPYTFWCRFREWGRKNSACPLFEKMIFFPLLKVDDTKKVPGNGYFFGRRRRRRRELETYRFFLVDPKYAIKTFVKIHLEMAGKGQLT